jgi:hypothetical protein
MPKAKKEKKYSGPGSVILLYGDLLSAEFQKLCDEHELTVSKPKARQIKRRIDDMANLLQSRANDFDD